MEFEPHGAKLVGQLFRAREQLASDAEPSRIGCHRQLVDRDEHPSESELRPMRKGQHPDELPAFAFRDEDSHLRVTGDRRKRTCISVGVQIAVAELAQELEERVCIGRHGRANGVEPRRHGEECTGAKRANHSRESNGRARRFDGAW